MLTILLAFITLQETVSLVREAYIYATPLIFTDVTRRVAPYPDNFLNHFETFPDHTFRDVVAPNNDTNYSTAFLDLSQGPINIELPDTKGRYYVFPLLDAWTNNFFLPGFRTTGTAPQAYVVTGPHWPGGDLPGGFSHIQSPTNMVWIIGRIQVNSPQDQAGVVLPLQRQFRLTSPHPPHKRRYQGSPSDTALQGKSVVQIIRDLSIEDYFNYFNALLADNPPAPADSAIIRRLSAIGIGEGLHFSLTDFPRETADALKAVPQEVYAEMDRAALTPGSRSTLFGRSTADSAARLGDFKTDYNHRALVACKGLGALPPEEATYFSLYHDSEGRPLDGAYTYRLRFDAQRLPPAKAFWSITVYDADRYLVDNPIGRYAIGDRNPLQFNADGSLDIYLSHKEPVDGTAPLSNWLPLPHAAFNLTFRLYVPEAAFLQSPASWSPPLPSPQIY